MPEQGILLHQRFLREMEENRERILPCRTGAEVDEAVGQGKAAALLSIEAPSCWTATSGGWTLPMTGACGC